jgi:septal ring factor EnvC (AmiA/AmiB activator)
MASRKAPTVVAAPQVAEQETRIKQLEAEIIAQNQANSDRERQAAEAAAAESTAARANRGRRSTIATGPQGVLGGAATEAPMLKSVLG